MESTVSQRIKEYVDVKHISLNALAKTLNMNQSTVLRQVKGEQTLSSTLVENFLIAYPEVSAEWLLRGCGDMVLGKSAANITAISANEPSLATDPVQVESEYIWQAKYEELEKRYDQLLSILGGGVRQSKVNVG